MRELDFRVIRMNSGESFLCICEHENDDTITVLFPLLIKTQTIPIAKNILREIHSTSIFCPFTDDKHFTFYKPELTFIKKMGNQAVTYYIDMLNRNEEIEALKAYDLHELIQPEAEEEIMRDDISQRVENLLDKMEQIEEETEQQEVLIVSTNKTLH